MAKSLFKSLLLPGFFVSCTVFTGLIVVLVSNPSNLVLLQASQDESDRLPQMSIDEQRDHALRAVGVSIIISVASGIVTAAMLGKWHAFHETAQAKAKQFGIDETSLELASLPIDGAAEPTQSSPASNSLNNSANGYVDSPGAFTEFSDIAASLSDQALPIWGEALLSDPNLLDLKTDIAFAEPDGRANPTSSTPVLHQPTDENLLPISILASPQEYQYQRVKVADGKTRRFAILFDGQYYCLSKVEKKRENALKVAAKLTQLEAHVVITLIKRGYAVWVLEANALPDSPLQ